MEKGLDDIMPASRPSMPIFIEKFEGDADFKLLIDQLNKLSNEIHNYALQFDYEDPRNKEILDIVAKMRVLKNALQLQFNGYKLSCP